MPKPEFYTCQCNDETVVFDAAKFDRGVLRFAWGGEQCEDCGVDLDEACVVRVVPDASGVLVGAMRCACGARYDARPAVMVDDWVRDLEPCGAESGAACRGTRLRPCLTHEKSGP